MHTTSRYLTEASAPSDTFPSQGCNLRRRTLIQAEKNRWASFLRFDNAFSTLYPRESKDTQLPDAMLIAI